MADLTEAQATVAALTQVAQAIQNSGLDRLASFTKEFHENSLKAKQALDEALERMGLIGQSYQHMRLLSEANNFQRKIANEQQQWLVEEIKEEIELHDSLYTKLDRYVKLKQDQLMVTKENNRQLVAAGKTVDETAAGLANVNQSASKIEQWLTKLPGGGILAFFLMGMRGDSEHQAQAQQVTQIFDRVGAGAGSYAGHIKQVLFNARAEMNMSLEDLRASAAGFAQSGIDAEQALKSRSSLSAMGLRNNALEATVQLDKFLELSSGTSAKMVGSAVANFGQTIEGSIEAFVKYGFAARDAGWDMGTFMNSVMSASENLKFYNVQLDDMAGRMLRAQQIGRDLGYKPEHAAQWGAAALGQVNSNLMNMGAGMTVWIGREVGAAMKTAAAGMALSKSDMEAIGNLSDNPLSTLVQMKHGAQGITNEDMQAKFWGTTIGTLAKKAMDAGHGNKDVAEYFLTTQGYTWEAARLILRLKDEVSPEGKLNPKRAAELQGAMASESEKTSAMTRSLQAIETGLMQVSNGLLGAILSVLKGVALGITALAAFFIKPSLASGLFDQAAVSLTEDVPYFGGEIISGVKNMAKFGGHLMDVEVIKRLMNFDKVLGGTGAGRSGAVSVAGGPQSTITGTSSTTPSGTTAAALNMGPGGAFSLQVSHKPNNTNQYSKPPSGGARKKGKRK